MTCYEVQQRLPIFLDGTLDEADSTAVQAHLASCHRCRTEAEAMRSLESQLRTLFRDEPVPLLLWPRICASLAHHESAEVTVVRKRASLPRFGWMAAAVFLLVIGVALFRTVLWSPARLEARLLSVPVQDLHTFVISQRPLDITSTDPQRLRRWFQERVDFAPPLLPVQVGHARLTGGRLCYFLERLMATTWPCTSCRAGVCPGHEEGPRLPLNAPLSTRCRDTRISSGPIPICSIPWFPICHGPNF